MLSFAWPELEEYLSIGGFSLVRMFDFTLLRRGQFGGWSKGAVTVVERSKDFFYRQKIISGCAYTRGVQIIRPSRDPLSITKDRENRWRDRTNRQHASFVAMDWRHGKVVEISTDPAATTNYFDASLGLPFELSPAFFRPEVLSKYKTDREKYTVDEREIHCRASWTLRGFDVNAAGQIHAYICDLRALPYREQLHWLSFNEDPKDGISQRAFVHDFKGEFADFSQPRGKLLSVARRWQDSQVPWWKLRDEGLLDRANTPLSSSRDEWAEAIMDLSKLFVEGFEVKDLRAVLDDAGVAYKDEMSIGLLEKIIAAKSGGSAKLDGLRTAQLIRTKSKGHAVGREAKAIAQAALKEHGTYAEHFNFVCELIRSDLEAIEKALTKP